MADALDALLRQTITHRAYVSQDQYGIATYGDSVTYPARVEARSRLIAGSAGQTVTARGRIFYKPSTVPSVRDEFTLPDGYVPQTPPVLDVQPQVDGAGRLHHVVVWYG